MARTIFLIIVFGTFTWMLFPFLAPVCLGAVFAAVCYPYYKKFEKKLHHKRSLTAFLTTLLVSVLVILPLTVVLISAVQTGVEEIKTSVQQTVPNAVPKSTGSLERIFSSGNTQKILTTVNRYYPIDLQQLRTTTQNALSSLAMMVGNWFTQLLAGIPGALLAGVLLILSLFFFLRDGDDAVDLIKKVSVFNADDTQEILKYSRLMCRSVLLALLVSGTVQALVFSIACLIAGVSGVVLITASVFFFSFLPLVGSAPITLGVAIFQFLVGNTSAGIFLLAMAGVVSALDNFVRPMVIRGAGDLHPFVTFLAALGGMKLFGVTGVFLGPIVAGITMVVMNVVIGRPMRRRALTH